MSGSALIFDKYELVRRLAIGGMGEVFIARQVSSISGFERHVILKSLLPDLANEPGFVDQFLDEARVAATLNHPNVVSVFEVGVSQGTYYLAMEFIPGMNLSQVKRASVQRTTPLPPHLLARMIQESAAGLHHAHLARDVQGQPLNLVHRDISPHNIMVREDGVTKVVDFGIASASNRSTRTRTGVVKGKLAYMSPEQLRAEPLDGRSDQFSLGIVFWELLTGQRLFSGPNDAKVAAAVLTSPIPPPSAHGAPASLDAIVLKMLEREAASRFATCEEVSRALDAWLKEQPPSDHSAVAAWLQQVAATELAAVNVTTPDDFVLKLRSSEGAPPPRASAPPGPNDERLTVDQRSPVRQGTIEISVSEESEAVRPSRSWRWAVGAVALLAMVGGGLALRGTGAVEPPRTDASLDAGLATTDVTPDAAVATVADEPPPPAVRSASLSVSSQPEGAKLQVDGRWVGQTPMTVPVDPGVAHKVRLELDGHKRATADVPALDAGVLYELDVKLQRQGGGKVRTPPPPEPQGADAMVSVKCDPPADAVYFDGKYRGVGTQRITTSPGKHTLELEASGRPRKVIELVLTPGEHEKVPCRW